MRQFAIAALLGCSAILFLSHLPSYLFIIIIFLLMVITHYYLRHSITLFLLIIILFFTYAILRADYVKHWSVPTAQQNQSVLIKGYIDSIPLQDNDAIHFNFKMTQFAEQSVNQVISLNWYQSHPSLKIGEYWQLRVKLKPNHGFANPGSVDEEAIRFEQAIVASGYVQNNSDNQLLHASDTWSIVGQLRQRMSEHIQQSLANSPYLPMILALVVGERTGMTTTQWQILQQTGTNHLMVIAGLHLGLFSGLIFFLIYRLWRCYPRAMLYLAAPRAAALAAILSAFIYALIAGFSIPTQRAFVMILIFMGALFYKRQLALGTGLALALLTVLIFNPLAVINVGFWLSFAAVGLIAYAMGGRMNSGPHWKQLIKLQIVVGVGLIPLTLLFFQNASWIAPIANAIAIPIVGFIVVPLSLLGAIIICIQSGVGGFILKAAAWVMAGVWHILVFLAALPGATIQWAMHPVMLISAMMGILLLFAPRGWPGRSLVVLYLLPLVWPSFSSLKTGEVRLTLLDVGQGLSAVVETRHHTLVFDTGAKLSEEYDQGRAVVVPFLRSHFISHLDTLVISHPDNDHRGGAASVLAAFPVNQILTSVPTLFQSEQVKTRVVMCLAGQHWQWDGVDFNVVYPDKSHLGLDNDSSCVLHITTGQHSILLTGDIEKSVEHDLLATQADIKSNIIVAPHHGSITSSSQAFIHAVKPQWVLFPVGYFNRYHFPNPIVVRRYEEQGAVAYQSDRNGAISMTLSPDAVSNIEAYRTDHQHIWSWQP